MDTVTNTLGKTVTTKEVLDLPLNGRNFTQLRLLQAGVAPLTLASTNPAAACAMDRVTR